ncbi:hypothetical protein B0A49_11676 [Cryomyces minteri]|uniref:Uncharacterized protein n=1 Tax=Cryomyces minteri TaxID=331657 RepID=A0A4U0WMU5_9PEZI|nr:hypothetical protein B0A49_11676 [Cryomyces minteri]
MSQLALSAVKQSIPAVDAAASSPTDSGVEPRLPPSPPLSSSPVSIASRQWSEAVSKLLRLLRSRRDGIWTEQLPWDKHPLLREEYTELWERLEEDEDLRTWVEHKLRYDYDYDTQHFIIRMPTRLHEKFIVRVVARLRTQLDALASTNAELRKVIDAIHEEGSWTVPLGSTAESLPDQKSERKDSLSRKSPDYIFAYKGARWPSLALEVSYSQKRKDLDELAYSYIRGSGGSIKAVVGLDVEYTRPGKPTKSKEATVSLWRYRVEQDDEREEVGNCVQDVKDDTFRSDDGDALQGSLAFTLADFLPSSILRTLPTADHDLPITIPFSHLTADLTEAEAALAATRSRTGLSNTPPKKWAKRERETNEELDTQRERKYRALEDVEERKAAQEDADYAPFGQGHGTVQPVEGEVEGPRRMAVPRRSTRRSRAQEEG